MASITQGPSVFFNASAVPISGFGAPARTAIAMIERVGAVVARGELAIGFQ